MKKKWMFLTLLVLYAATLFGACGGGAGGEREDELYVDLHCLMPTASTVSTDTTIAVNASRTIAAEFEKQTGIKIRWALDRYTKPDAAGAAEWYATAIRKGDVPAIGYTFGSKLQDRGYYLDLTEYLEQPNEYVDGNVKWRDQFPEYLFNNPDVVDAKGRIVSVPITLYPGVPTGVYYNKDLLGEGKDALAAVPTTYGSYRTAVEAIKDAGKTAYSPNSQFTSPGFSQWINEYTVSPNYLRALIEQERNSPDFDRDGIVTTAEELRGVKAGYYNAASGPNKALVQQMMEVLRDYYQNVLPAGWENASYETTWKNGSLAMKEDGLWNIRLENNRNATRGFEYGVFSLPLVDKNFAYDARVKGSYAAETAYYAAGETVESPPVVTLNIMKDGATKQSTIDNAVKFLKFLCIPQYNKMMADEQVAYIGAVKGAQQPNTYLTDWMSQSFAKLPNAKWPFGYSTDSMGKLNLAFSKWINNAPGYSTTQFYADYDKFIAEGADTFIRTLDIDVTNW